MDAAEELSAMVGVKRACQDLAVPRSGFTGAAGAGFSAACGRAADFRAPFAGR